MSYLEKLKIAGVRNFNPDKPGTIKFFKPLTLIVGQNGSGKTTIIECLNTAITGTYPQNCSKLKGFLHDNELCDLETVHALIKLRIRSVNNEKITIIREISKSKNVTKSPASVTIEKNGMVNKKIKIEKQLQFD